MKKTVTLLAFFLMSIFTYACQGANTQSKAAEKQKSEKGKVIQMNKEMFINNIFDYKESQTWKFKGNKPALIDLYAVWCGPCRMVAPIMEELAKEYENKIDIYKINVDKERELASLLGASSIPLFVFIPMEGEPRLFNGAADKNTYKKIIDEFLLK